MMIDFAGQRMCYTRWDTEEVIQCQVFVAVFPYSNYSYVEAVHSQRQEDFIHCLVNALQYFGGVPGSILMDNFKSGVIRANRYEPVFTDLLNQFSVHYNVTLMATRPGKPKDKPHVEAAVKTVYTRIYAPLRNRVFNTLEDLNVAIGEQLSLHNALPFQRKEHCRSDLFMRYEKPLLRPLPTSAFEVKYTVEAKVQKNYHVILGEDWHQYSVPYEHVGKGVKIIYTRTVVEIYHQHERITMHRRNTSRNGFSTIKEHMPLAHQHQQCIKGWNEEDFKRMAVKVGPYTLSAIEKVLSSRMFHEQTYNSCLGILRLGSKYGNDRLETACKMLQGYKVNYRIIKNILENHQDKKTATPPMLFPLVPEHENIRGASVYQ